MYATNFEYANNNTTDDPINLTTLTHSSDENNNGYEALTFILQVLVIISALLSISWTPVTLKRMDAEHVGKTFTLTDYIFELMWNMLCISSRVIALALFASSDQSFWLGPLFIFHQILFWIFMTCTQTSYGYEHQQIVVILVAIYSFFNIYLPKTYYDHILYFRHTMYWIIMMIENTILITVWYTSIDGLNLWYHVPAIIYVIVSYLLSFIVKTFHFAIQGTNKVDNIKAQMSEFRTAFAGVQCVTASSLSKGTNINYLKKGLTG